MVHRYHYALQCGICKGVLAVCQVGLILRVGCAGRSRYPRFQKRWPVWRSLGRSKGLRGDAVRWWRRSRWRMSQPDQYGVSLRRPGVPRRPIGRLLECRRLSPRGRRGVECPPPPCSLGGYGLASLDPGRSEAGIGPR